MAKLWIVQELGYEYNDEYYSRPGCGGGKPIKAFKNKKNAEAEMKELNEKHRKENPLEDEDGTYEDYYEVVQVEFADEDEVSYKDARAAVEAARKSAQKTMESTFAKEASVLFGQHPELESFAWRQYTDYFNDGDTCTFGAHTDEPDINGVRGYHVDSGKEYDESAQKYVRRRAPSVEYRLQPIVAKFLNQFHNEDMEAMFGDHKQITVTRGENGPKVEVDDYTNHD